MSVQLPLNIINVLNLITFWIGIFSMPLVNSIIVLIDYLKMDPFSILLFHWSHTLHRHFLCRFINKSVVVRCFGLNNGDKFVLLIAHITVINLKKASVYFLIQYSPMLLLCSIFPSCSIAYINSLYDA